MGGEEGGEGGGGGGGRVGGGGGGHSLSGIACRQLHLETEEIVSHTQHMFCSYSLS